MGKKKKKKNLEESRFRMVKERHRKTFEQSLKGRFADKRIISLCKYLNSTEDYFTSSSCSGRIVLLGLPKGEEKKGSYFHRKWHRKVRFDEVWQAINSRPDAKTVSFTPERKKPVSFKPNPEKDELWFKLDSFILHIGCKMLEDAVLAFNAIQNAGIKRFGLSALKGGKLMIEVIGTQNIALPVKAGEKVLITEKHAKFMVKKANQKLGKNYRTLEKLEKEFRKVVG